MHDPNERKLATLNLQVTVYVGQVPTTSNPITGTELGYEYLAVGDIKVLKVHLHGDTAPLQLLYFDAAEDLDADGDIINEIAAELRGLVRDPFGE